MSVLAGTQGAVPMYAPHAGQAGGMTYRPPAPKQIVLPPPADCPWPKANGRPCYAPPTPLGVCGPHSHAMARAVGLLMQGA